MSLNLAPRVLFEDNHLLIINKLASDLVQVDQTGDPSLEDQVKQYIKEKYNKPGAVFLGVVHRLDRPTSGAIIFARTDKALSRLNELLRNHSIKKTYWAIVEKAPPKPTDRLVHYLKKNQATNKSSIVKKETEGAQLAVLSYQQLASSEHYHLLEIQLETGRHHQIRVQLSSLGCIIKGDLKYGAKRSNSDGSISLHARKLEFTHPIQKTPLFVVAPCPQDPLWIFFEKQLS